MFFKKKPSGPIAAMIVGLGNPGAKYNTTRHNVGFCAIDHIAKKLGSEPDKLKFQGLYCRTKMAGQEVILLKPQTFMNDSGKSVSQFASFFKIPAENIIVIFDDVLLDVGKLRIRRKGSHGGHNGIRSIVACLGSEDFPRIKIGVGKKPHPDYDLADWVLSPLPLKDRETVSNNMDKVYDAVCDILDGDFEKAMGKYN
ncbi:MAG: aminoacyl-tRNA hydrolase [Oscillospiraceae bacterium]|nr:aminoacyl-tRNA hydrolase [Oscillospiraceae bacterium]